MKISLTCVLCIVGSGLFALFMHFESETAAGLIYTKWQSTKGPEMWAVPQPLSTAAVDNSRGGRFSSFGYEFASPWTDVKTELKQESLRSLRFSSGAVIAIFDWSRTPNVRQKIQQDYGKLVPDMTQAFGGSADSNFEMRSRTFNITPRDLSIFARFARTRGNCALLIQKSIETKRFGGRVYSFQTPLFRGFQLGDPERDRVAMIEAFDAQDKEVEIWVAAQ